MSDRTDWLSETAPPPRKGVGTIRLAASVLLAGIGLLFLVPPIYATILDWPRNGVIHLLEMLPCCSIPSALCFILAWRIRHAKGPSQRKI